MQEPKPHIKQLAQLFQTEAGKKLREWMVENGLFRGIIYAEPMTPEQALRTLLYYLADEPECVQIFRYNTVDPSEEIEYVYAIKLGCEGDLSTFLVIVYGRHLSAEVGVIAISYPP